MISPTELALAVRRPAGRMGMGSVLVSAPGIGVDTTSGSQVAVDPSLPVGSVVDSGSSSVGPVIAKATPAPTGLAALSTGEKVVGGLGVLAIGYGLMKAFGKKRRR